MLGAKCADFIASRASIGGKNTKAIHVYVEDGVDAHCKRIKAAGAVIVNESADEFCGDRIIPAVTSCACWL
jgi:uncharacterized glyoxalase superfamily protein PhnB